MHSQRKNLHRSQHTQQKLKWPPTSFECKETDRWRFMWLSQGRLGHRHAQGGPLGQREEVFRIKRPYVAVFTSHHFAVPHMPLHCNKYITEYPSLLYSCQFKCFSTQFMSLSLIFFYNVIQKQGGKCQLKYWFPFSNNKDSRFNCEKWEVPCFGSSLGLNVLWQIITQHDYMLNCFSEVAWPLHDPESRLTTWTR